MKNKPVVFNYKKIAAAISLIGIATSSSTLMAQEDGLIDVEEIQVTGSFISRPADRPQPVTVLDNEAIEDAQRVSLVEVLRDLPQISSGNTTSNNITPTSSINLRGLGSRSTLILLNGQRQTIDANAGSQVDVNNLAPSIMIERIEIVLDGASALYGSDAVAGVANFITRNTFEGAEFTVSTQHADAQFSIPEVTVAGLFGVQSDDIGIVMGLEYVTRADRMDSGDIRSDERLSEGLITALWNPGTFLGEGGWFPDPLCGSPEIGGLEENVIYDPAGALNHSSNGLPVDSDPFCRGLLSLERTFIPESERLTGMAITTLSFDNEYVDALTVEMGFSKTEQISSYGTGVPLLALPSINNILPATNPGVIDAHQRDPNFPLQDYTRIFSRQLSPLDGSLKSFSKQFTYRVASTLEGTFGSNSLWDWRVTGTFSQNDQQHQLPDSITDRYSRAVQGYGGPGCKFDFVSGAANDSNIQPGEGDCQYWNPFASRLLASPGDPTYNSPELLEWMQHGALQLGNAQFYSVEAVATGQLWEMAGGTTGVAFGAQFRKQDLEIIVDPIAKDGGFAFSPQVLQDWDSTRDTNAFFGELVIFPTGNLELDVAVRYEETLGESSTDPKISALWTPTDNLYIRASAGSSFRLPSENDLFGIGPGSVARFAIGGETIQASGLARGNPNLTPETSENWTLGFTWDATDSLTFDMTYWSYNFTDLVTSTDATDTLNRDIEDGFIDSPANPLFPGRPNEVCEITGRWSGLADDPLPAGCATGFDIQILYSSFVNQNAVETSGVDFSADFSTEAWGGQVGLTLAGAYVLDYKGTNVSGELQDVAGTDGLGVAGVDDNPQLRFNLTGSYLLGDHTFRATARYTGGTELTDDNPLLANYDESDYTTLDLTYSYALPTKNASTLTVAIVNATDEEPPLRPNGLNTFDPAIYDGRGRMWRFAYNYSY